MDLKKNKTFQHNSFYAFHVQQRNVYSFIERETCCLLFILVFTTVPEEWMDGGMDGRTDGWIEE